MPPNKESPRRRSVRAGAWENVELGDRDVTEDATDTLKVQAAWLRRRYGLKPARAALIAKLAMSEAA